MPKLTTAELVRLTGISWRTCRKRLDAAQVAPVSRERNADRYESTEALAALYVAPSGSAEESATEAKARLTAAQADLAEIELAQTRKELIPADEVTRAWTGKYAAMRARLLAMPTRVATQVSTPDRLAEVEAKIRRIVHEALKELSDDARGA